MLFDRECERMLLANSSSVKSVYLWSDSACDKAVRLGRALRGNTHVRQLRLLLSRFRGMEILGAFCSSLKAVRLLRMSDYMEWELRPRDCSFKRSVGIPVFEFATLVELR